MSANIPYLVGNTKGRDHPLWPIVTLAPPYGTSGALEPWNWTAPANLATIMATLWRVKTWELSGGGTLHFQGDTDAFYPASGARLTMDATLTFSGTVPMVYFDGSTYVVATDERQIIANFDASYFPALMNAGFYLNAITSGSSSVSYTATKVSLFDPTLDYSIAGSHNLPIYIVLMGSYAQTLNAPVQYFNDATKLFSPLLIFETILGLHDHEVWSFLVENRASLAVAGDLTIDPLVAPPLVSPVRGNLQTASATYNNIQSGGLTIALTATEFWPFQNRLGQPVFDTATGVQINALIA